MVEQFELEEAELVLLREAVRLTDTLDDLHAVIAEEGAVITDTRGERRTHPAVVEARQSRIALARVLAVLRVPSGEEGENLRRPQRRSGARGTYQLHHRRLRSA